MRVKKILPLLILILPLFLLYLGVNYHDNFYFILSAISFIFSILIAIPKFLSSAHIRLPSFNFQGNENKKTTEHKVHTSKHNFLLLIFRSQISILFVGYLILFTYISVFRLPLITSNNIITSYFNSFFNYFGSGGALLVILSLVTITLVVYLLRGKSKEKFSVYDYPRSKVKGLILIIITMLLAFNFSLATTFVFAIGEANFLSAQIKANPGSAGIIWGKDKVLQKLKSMDHPPSIAEGGKDFNAKVIVLESKNDSSRSTFYTQFVMKNLPADLILSPGIPTEPLVMFHEGLIINSLDQSQMEVISPTLGKLLVKKYFGNRFIKDEPQLQVLGRQDYLKFREDQINDQLAKLDDLIKKVTDVINAIYGNINLDKQKIAFNQDGLNTSISQRDSSYNDCTNSGYYFYGYFYHTFTQAFCDSQKSKWDTIIEGWQKNISDWQSSLQSDQASLPQYLDAKKTLTNYHDLVSSQKESTPQELGLFTQKDKSIKLALDYTGSKSLTEYLETLSHEYLQCTSYVSEERTLLPFFEEGLTEYYARKVIKEELGKDTNIGYPLLVKIIQQMVSKIPESELQDIYFSKDQTHLQSALDNAYGKDFYKNSQYYFGVMTYVSPKDALKFANNIMIKIGGKALNESDLQSTLPQVN